MQKVERRTSDLTQTIPIHLYMNTFEFQKVLIPQKTDFLRAESFYNVASYIDEIDADSEARGNPVTDSLALSHFTNNPTANHSSHYL